jgi:exonuclease III
MARNNRHLLILTLNISGLNLPIKRYRIANWVTRPNICHLQETHLTEKNKHWLRVKGLKAAFQANEPHKQAGVVIIYLTK